jgi:phage tail-like protein
MADRNMDPLRNFRFKVEIDGIVQAGFSEATGFDSTSDVIEYREGTDPTHPRKLPGLTKYSDITLKWGQTDARELYNWRQQVIDGGIASARKTVYIVVLDETGAEKLRFRCDNAWPSKLDPPDFNAKGNDVAVSALTLTCEEVKLQ